MPKPETKHITTKATVTEDGDGQGLIEAVFSTFGNIDSAGDVVLKSAFTDGQEVPMVWSHNWDMPIGKGVVKVTPKQAVFKGQLWLDTEDGMQAFLKIRNAGSLQEFSWGFQVTDAEPGVVDGQDVRLVKGAELFEVSPVLVGANRQTHLLSIKAAEVVDAPDPEPDPVPAIEVKSSAGSFDWIRQRVYHALGEDTGRFCCIEDLYPDRVIYSTYGDGPMDAEELYGRSYTIDGAGAVTLGDATPVDVQYVAMANKWLSDRAELVTADLRQFARRASTSADLADDETRDALKAAITRLEHAQRELSAALKRTDPIAQVEPRNLLRRFQEVTARHGLSTTPKGGD